jgi:hypothetical protein
VNFAIGERGKRGEGVCIDVFLRGVRFRKWDIISDIMLSFQFC